MYSAVVQRTCLFKTAYFKTRLLGLGVFFAVGVSVWFLVGWLVFFGFFCSWHDRAAKTLCFLTLACQRSVITEDSTLALSLPAWILRGWERLLAFWAWLSGEEYFTLLSQCPGTQAVGVFLPH